MSNHHVECTFTPFSFSTASGWCDGLGYRLSATAHPGSDRFLGLHRQGGVLPGDGHQVRRRGGSSGSHHRTARSDRGSLHRLLEVVHDPSDLVLHLRLGLRSVQPASSEADLHVIYVENPLVGGGWAGVFQVIMHSWYEPNVAGIVEGNAFAPHATDGLAHEFGHFRGAIDIYAINVDPAKNPVNHTGFQAKDTLGETIMDYAYDHQVIDAYSRCIIEKSADTVNDEVPVVAQTLPGTYQVNVKTAAGANVAGASVKLYPVEWYSNSVTASPVVTGTTASNGLYQLSSNPFRTPESVTKPWGTVAGNFLVEVRKGSQVSYSWLPISAAGLSACTHPGEDFVLSLTLG